MNTRLSTIGFLTFERGRRGGLQRALVIGLAVAGLLVYVGGKVSIYQLGYRIESLKKEKQDLERANRALTIEASSLTSSARIEEIAVKRLGMVHPAEENIVVVRRKHNGVAQPGRKFER